MLHYPVKIFDPVNKLHNEWNSGLWADIAPLQLEHYMGSEPKHRPKTEIKLCCDSQCIHFISRVQDKYVRAVNENTPEKVCHDSCVEFFFSPSRNVSKGYFNIEMNCGGTILVNFQTAPGHNVIDLRNSRDKFEIYHSMPVRVEPEVTEPTVWTVAYCFPFELLQDYRPLVKPEKGCQWRANFYKCGDHTSHPHWLTWNRIECDYPDFHRPESFGILDFI